MGPLGVRGLARLSTLLVTFHGSPLSLPLTFLPSAPSATANPGSISMLTDHQISPRKLPNFFASPEKSISKVVLQVDGPRYIYAPPFKLILNLMYQDLSVMISTTAFGFNAH